MRSAALLVVLGILLSAVAHGQLLPSARTVDEEVTIDADSITYDQRANTISAAGNVIIRRGMTELQADEVTLHRDTNIAEAHGNVSVNDPEGTLFAESVSLDLDDETASLSGATLKSKRLSYSLRGGQIDKGLGQSYRIVDGHFTTCDCDDGAPSWSIRGNQLDVTLDGYGIVRGASFLVLDVPILYLPRAVIPIQRERQSGFLMPRFGASNRRGFQTLLPFYWALSKSHDLTVGFDLETSARIGLLGDYRYARSRQSDGTLSASYFNEFLRGDRTRGTITVPNDRWSIATEQREAMGRNGWLYTDSLMVSDDVFFREINTYAFEHHRTVAIRTLPFTASRLGAVQLWERAAARLEGTYYQNLGDDIESRTLQVAPRLGMWGQWPIGQLLLVDGGLDGVSFQRAQGPAGGRIHIEPGVTFPIPVGRFGYGSVRLAATETAYLLNNDLVGDGPRSLPDRQNREQLTLRSEVGSIFQRIYDVHRFGLAKVKHTIEPSLGYFYVPSVGQADLPLWDGIDRINHRNLLTYGVSSRLLGKAEDDAEPSNGNGVRELARVSLVQSYDISRAILPLKQRATQDHFSDIDLGGRVNPNRFFSLRFLTNFDAAGGDFSATKVGFFIEDPRDEDDSDQTRRLDTRTSAGVSYRFLTNNLLHQVDANVVLRLTDTIGFIYASRYNVVAQQFLDNFFGLRLISSCDCWALDLAITNRTNPNETEARAQLTLVGLSSEKRARRAAVMP